MVDIGVAFGSAHLPDEMKEAEIKLGVLRTLDKLGLLADNVAITSELAIEGHKRRIDLAVFGSKAVGIEIKSAADTLRRLEPQAQIYLPYFDELMVVVAEKHAAKAAEVVPPQASLWTIESSGAIRIRRPASASHEPAIQSKLRFLTLRDLRRLAPVELRSAARSELVEYLLDLDRCDLVERVRSCLNSKFRLSTLAFRNALKNDLPPSQAIPLLSRSYERRMAERALSDRTRQLQENWLAAVAEVRRGRLQSS